MHDF